MRVIDHASVGVTDLDAARRFYDAALAPLGLRRTDESDGQQGYGPSRALNDFHVVLVPAGDGGPRQGAHLAFVAASRGAVDGFFQAAVAAGGTGEWSPRIFPQYHESYYAAFVLDPFGNRIEAVCHAPPPGEGP